MTTLKVTIGEGDRLRRTARERIRAAERGEPLEDADPVLNFDSYATLAKFFSETNLALLDAIVDDEPPSIRQAAALVDRDYRDVHRNLSELESLGVVQFEGGGPGKAKKPIVPYDEIDITLSLGEDSVERSVAPS